ncbi:MAG: cyclase family protein [bacterium]|nr:cyclase family protein [bacterium]
MKVIDLTHTITPGMPVYPGSDPPVIAVPYTVANDGFEERNIALSSHTGTHIDAPSHIIQGGAALDHLPISHFTGCASRIDLTRIKGTEITPAHLKPHENLIASSEFILLYSGWSRYWGDPRYFEGFPVLNPDAASLLAGFPLKGIGIDMLSVDENGSTSLPIHNILLGRGILLIENLTRLEQLPRTGFTFCCFPLKVEEADASPIRAAALF